MKKQALSSIFAAAILAACGSPAPETSTSEVTASEAEQPVLHIYSSRHYDSDKQLYAAFEAASGAKLQVREGKADQLLETMKAEGENSPADLVIAADAGALWRFQDAGLTQPVASETLNDLIPETLREENGHWFGLTQRVRLVAYDPTRVSADQLATWNDLTDPALAGEICVRSSSNIYNLSLMGEMIHRVGFEPATAWASGIVANMARNPQGGDTDQIKAVAAGQCSVAIVNHYYWSRLAASDSASDNAVAEATQLIIPGFGDRGGAHANVTGAAVTTTADQAELATDFIAYLMTQEGQELLTTETQELPILDSAAKPSAVEALPPFTRNPTPLSAFGENQAEAQRAFDLAGWN